MSWLSDTFLGSRPDMRQLPGTNKYLDEIGAAGDVGLGPAGRFAKQDLIAMREGRIEETGRLRPVLSAINANKASAYKTRQRENSKNFAFSPDPALQDAIMQQTSGELDENAGVQFANAASGAYGDAENAFTRAKQFRDTLKYQSAVDRARANQSSYYDARRQGGLLNQMISAGAGLGQLGALAAV